MKVTFLGTGTSVGVPRIGCNCSVCRSIEKKNKRYRSSIHLAEGNSSILVDTGPDLRSQALTFGISQVDAVLFTHEHVDHLYGLDDVRCYCFNQNNTPLPCYGDPRTLSRIEKVFDYAFNNKAPSSTPNLELIEIKGPFKVCGIEVIPIEVLHGKLPVLAFRIGDFAYVTDANYINGSNLKKLEGVETLVIGALRHKPHPTHFNVEQALEIIEHLKPQKSYLTHIAHEIDHYPTNASLPKGVELAFDGLTFKTDLNG